MARPLARSRTRGPLGLAAGALLFALAAPPAQGVVPVAVATALAPVAPVASASAADEDGYVKKVPPVSTPWTAQVGPKNALPEYPRPQMTRAAWQNLNGVWQFAAAAPGDPVPFGRDLAERVLVPYPIESALSGIMRHEDRMFYRRTFTVPDAWRTSGQRVQLHFGAVDYASAVWVNGDLVAQHVGGYDPFSADVTDALTASGPQEIVVAVFDSTNIPNPTAGAHESVLGDPLAMLSLASSSGYQPVGKQRFLRGSIFYTAASGIWQTVWMEPTPASRITTVDRTPDIQDESLSVTVRTAGAQPGQLAEAVAYAGDVEVGRVTGPADKALRLPVPAPRLWSPDDPHLYDLRVRLLDGDTTVDRVDSYFGMRSITLGKTADGRTRTFLNGKPLTQIGPLDQGYWPDGIYTAPTDAALRFDLEETKRLGFNMTRKHIKVEPWRWYYWADRIGLMVWQDMPSIKEGEGTNDYPPPAAREEFVKQLQRMVETHKDFPSIIMWVPFNEGWGEWDKEATGQIADQVKSWDPSRLVNAHSGALCCYSNGDSGKGDILDDHRYPGPGEMPFEERRASVAGEYGGYGLRSPGHQWGSAAFAWQMTTDKDSLTSCVVGAQRRLGRLVKKGLAAGVYTQATDVEDELNGFLTYDRKVMKFDVDRIRAVNRAIIENGDIETAGNVVNPPGDPASTTETGRWAFDEGAGATARDSSGRGRDGTLKGGATWVPGHKGSAVAVNGTTGFVEVPSRVIDTGRDFTVSAWVRMNAPAGNWETFVSEDTVSSSAFFLQYSQVDRKFAFSTTAGRAVAKAAPVAGQWYHLVGVRNASGLTLYVNGERQSSIDACMPDRATGSLVIGRGQYQGSGVDYANGSIDEVRVYERALSDSDVEALHTAER